MRGRRFRLSLLVGALVTLLAVGVANADNIWVTNSGDKYWGAKAHVHESPIAIDVVERQYQGSNGSGGAMKWRLYNLADWAWNGSTYVLKVSWPPGSFPWRYNITEGTTWWTGGYGYIHNSTAVAVLFDFQHQQNVSPFGYWYSYAQLDFQYP